MLKMKIITKAQFISSAGIIADEVSIFYAIIKSGLRTSAGNTSLYKKTRRSG